MAVPHTGDKQARHGVTGQTAETAEGRLLSGQWLDSFLNREFVVTLIANCHHIPKRMPNFVIAHTTLASP